ncbi:MAG: hypothetical protein IJD13_01700, partial [Oscillospiraceae bacterium]|nr:hypothetical protein [Oscillospiraceae bacterium]
HLGDTQFTGIIDSGLLIFHNVPPCGLAAIFAPQKRAVPESSPFCFVLCIILQKRIFYNRVSQFL